MSDQLQQQKLSFHSSERMEAKRPEPISKLLKTTSPTLLHSHRRRRKVGGINEINVVRAFQQSRAHQDAEESDSDVSTDESPSLQLHRDYRTQELTLHQTVMISVAAGWVITRG